MNKMFLYAICLMIYFITRLLHQSYRYRYNNVGVIQKLNNNKQNFIFAVWHQNLFAGILAQTGSKFTVIVSKSNDAEPVAFTCKQLGHLVVRGSSKKGDIDKNGKLAKEEMIQLLSEGHPGAVTVDGPRGPAFIAKPGIIDMAKKAKVLLVPYSIAPASYWEFKSWDRFRLPKPFSKILISYGEPIRIDEEATNYEADQKKLETAMNAHLAENQKNLLNWKNYSLKNWF